MDMAFNIMAPNRPDDGWRARHNFPVWACLGLAILLTGSRPAAAQEQMLFPAVDDARAVIVQKIRNEHVRLDIAVWYLQDDAITSALLNKFREGVPVRLIGDRVSVFEIDPHTRNRFELLASNGVPIRLRYHPTSFPEIMHWKCGIFVGQNTVEFGSANWTGFELAPWSPDNFKDETVMFTNDPPLVNAFLTQFDRMWANTSHFLDWPEAYRLETGNVWPTPLTISRARLEPDYPTNVPGMIWGQGPELNNAMAAEIDAEQSGVDMVVYRLSDPVISDAVIRRRQAGVPVRIFVEPEQYRQSSWPEYWLTGAHIDRMWAAGARVKIRTHLGLTHMKTLITSRVALNGSSNFTRNWQRDHNYFIPAQSKPVLYQAMRNRFDAMWADNTHYTDFYPLRPDTPAFVAPANDATGVSTAPTLEWRRAPWAVAFDVYLGTSPSALVFQGRVNAQLTESPPLTYSWTPSQALQGGTTYYWRVVARTFATDVDPLLVASTATRAFTTSGSSGGGTPGVSTPFSGTPVALPGTIQAENFDNGGMHVAYYDTTAGNSGGVYRNTDVDIEATSDTGGGYNVGWMAVGEWLKYTVNVTTAGTYDIQVRVAAPRDGGTFHIEVDGVDRTGPMTIPNTGGWQNWTTITRTGVALNAGQQVWRLVIDSMPPGGAVGNVNWIRAVSSGGEPPPPPPPPGSTPYTGTPVALPGTIQAENFDNGGQNVAYFDNTPGNAGGAYRATDVDIAVANDVGGGYTIGWVAAGEWLNYTVNVTAAGTYDIEARVASAGQGGTFRIEVNGVDKTGPITVPNTGGWQSWTTIRRAGVSLSAGQQVWRVVMLTTGPSTGAVGNFNWFRVAAPTAPPPSAPQVVLYASDVAPGSLQGNWTHVADATAAGGVKLSSADLGFAATSNALASPAHYFQATFSAQAGVRYRLWLRMRAQQNDKFNDSVWVQFSGSVNAGAAPVYRIGTTSGLNVNLATSAAGDLSGWGWQNRAYWLADTGEIWFAASGTQTIRVQLREDGVEIDQIVLSPSQYVDTAPGPVMNDATIVPKP
jgi:phosphatidylserine/phosphatidylglycerophosphate/cardiolipin synthase-like enzyme